MNHEAMRLYSIIDYILLTKWKQLSLQCWFLFIPESKEILFNFSLVPEYFNLAHEGCFFRPPTMICPTFDDICEVIEPVTTILFRTCNTDMMCLLCTIKEL